MSDKDQYVLREVRRSTSEQSSDSILTEADDELRDLTGSDDDLDFSEDGEDEDEDGPLPVISNIPPSVGIKKYDDNDKENTENDDEW